MNHAGVSLQIKPVPCEIYTLKPTMPVQAWGRIPPQRSSAVDGRVSADRSNWRVQAKKKMARDKTATVRGLTTRHF